MVQCCVAILHALCAGTVSAKETESQHCNKNHTHIAFLGEHNKISMPRTCFVSVNSPVVVGVSRVRRAFLFRGRRTTDKNQGEMAEMSETSWEDRLSLSLLNIHRQNFLIVILQRPLSMPGRDITLTEP